MNAAGIGPPAALNGKLTQSAHAALPVPVEELARDAAACVATRARAISKDANGRLGLRAPRLQPGDGEATRVLLMCLVRRSPGVIR